MEGIPRNHEIFEPLDFLAELTQHIPDRGEHQIRYYGWYSNKSRGVREKALKAALAPNPVAPLAKQQLRFRITWAALIRMVYEVDPLKCPGSGDRPTTHRVRPSPGYANSPATRGCHVRSPTYGSRACGPVELWFLHCR